MFPFLVICKPDFLHSTHICFPHLLPPALAEVRAAVRSPAPCSAHGATQQRPSSSGQWGAALLLPLPSVMGRDGGPTYRNTRADFPGLVVRIQISALSTWAFLHEINPAAQPMKPSRSSWAIGFLCLYVVLTMHLCVIGRGQL